LSSHISPDITFVMPTLGGTQLEKTIAAINDGSLVPGKILVCIPPGAKIKANLPAGGNTVIVHTDSMGQVTQRAFGMKLADTPYIVQLDDDILLEHECLEHLVAAARTLGKGCAVSPSFINPGTGKSLYRIATSSRLKKLYYWLLNGPEGYRPGTITRAGTAFGIDMTESELPLEESEWLPGGCVLHHKESVISDNYFPFDGKAYTEDMYFSRLAKNRELKLYISRDSRCYVDPVPPVYKDGAGVFFRNLLADMKARKHYVQDTGKSLFRMYGYYLVQVMVWLKGKAWQ
jgi:glycosyltransferase involved in cell wall biosynthesis